MTADPWDPPTITHEPDLTAEEWQAIRDEIWDAPWTDPTRYPECLSEAVFALRDVGLNGDPFSRRVATQCLRKMVQRSVSGVPFGEPVKPAWSLDPEPRNPGRRS